MYKCKLCGAANTPTSTVCVQCGASLDQSTTNSAEKNNEIFSSTDSGGRAKKEVADLRKEIYSSDSTYQKARHKKVLEKIRIQEEALGEIPNTEEFEKKEQVIPVVINRDTSSDIVDIPKPTVRRNGGARQSNSGKHTIPQRIIEPVDSQKVRRKSKTTGTSSSDEGEKVELKPSEAVENIQNRRSIGNSVKSQSKDYCERDKKRDKLVEKQGEKTLKQFETKRQSEEKRLEREDILEANSQKTIQNQMPKKRPVQKTAERAKTESNTSNTPVPKKRPVQRTAEGSKTESNATKTPVPKKRPIQQAAEGSKTESNATKTPVPKKRPIQQAAEGSKIESNATKTPVSKKRPIQQAAEVSKTESNATKTPVPKKRPIQQTIEGTKTESNTTKTPVPKKRPVQRTEEKDFGKQKAAQKPKLTTALADDKKIDDSPYLFSEKDIDENKYLAALSYIGIFFVLPFAKRNESEFCKAHARQGAALFVYSIIVYLISLLAVLGLRFLLVWTLKLPFIFYTVAMLVVVAAMLALLFIPVFKGAYAAFSGTYQKVPIVGRLLKESRTSSRKKTKKVKKTKRTGDVESRGE